jgi:outer membrane protein
MKKLVVSLCVVGAGVVYLLAQTARVDDRAKPPVPVTLAVDAGGKNGAVAAPLPLPVAVVSLQEVAEKCDMAKKFQKDCTEKIEAIQKELQSLLKDHEEALKKQQELLEKSKNPALTEEARKKAKEEAEKKMEEVQQKQFVAIDFKVNSENRIVEAISSGKVSVLKAIKDAVEEIAREMGFGLVVDGSSPSVVFASVPDITKYVIERVNAKEPEAEPKKGDQSSSASATAAAAPVAASAK